MAARTIVKDLEMTISNRIPVLTPQGHLMLAPTEEARILPDNLRDRLESAFERGAGHGLLELGIREVGTALPADFAYWRDFAGLFSAEIQSEAGRHERVLVMQPAKDRLGSNVKQFIAAVVRVGT